MFKRLPWEIVLLLVAGVMSGCSSTGRMASGWARDYEPPMRTVSETGRVENSDASRTSDNSANTPQNDEPSGTLGERDVESVDPSAFSDQDQALEFVLRQEISNWLGVPHVLGGTSSRGIDCSGLVQRIYADALNVKTPRTTEGLQRTGQKVNSRELQAGDLVFFRPGNDYSHVGIFLSDNEFVHASSSNGVMISNLSESYWRRRYTTSRRIIASTSDRAAAAAYGVRTVNGNPASEE